METELRLLSEIKTISRSYKRVANATGQNFNIFSILEIETHEVGTHSRFIAELLNPRGSHNLKDVFLIKFLKKYNIQNFNSQGARVHVEHHIGKVEVESGGRLDIFIKDVAGNIIMIENKIYAGEQLNQLLRYKNAYPKGKLFYLTLFGNQSNQLTSRDLDYQAISYEEDIINWLEECRKESAVVPLIRETISQYINLLKKLTNQNYNREMSKEIVEKILDNKENFEAFRILLNSKKEVLKEVFNTKVFPLLEVIALQRNAGLTLDKNALLNQSGKWMGFSFRTESMEAHNIKISFSFNVASGYRNFIYGFTYIDPKIKTNHTVINEIFQKQMGASKSSQWWVAYKDYDQFSNWEELATLKKIAFGDFKEDFEDKVSAMFSIYEAAYEVKSVSDTAE